jgi:hypothetical protein
MTLHRGNVLLQLGNMLTRGMYATRLLEKLDTNGDKALQLTEIKAAMDREAPPGKYPDWIEFDHMDRPKSRGVSIADIREICPDELERCEKHEGGCDKEILLSLKGQLKGEKSDELKAVIKCYGGRGPGGVKARAKSEL